MCLAMCGMNWIKMNELTLDLTLTMSPKLMALPAQEGLATQIKSWRPIRTLLEVRLPRNCLVTFLICLVILASSFSISVVTVWKSPSARLFTLTWTTTVSVRKRLRPLMPMVSWSSIWRLGLILLLSPKLMEAPEMCWIQRTVLLIKPTS